MPIFQHPLFVRISRILSIALILLLVGMLSRPIEAPAWQTVKAGQPEMNLEDIEGALGQGLVVGVLGGFRAILADFLWIRTNTVWQRRDRAKLDAMVRLVTTLDPRPEFFWINGSRMIGYDVPNWRIVEEGGYQAVPEARQKEIGIEQAEQAFEYLDKALEFHPDHAKFYLEKGNIYMIRLKDDANAAAWFLKASQQDDAPYFAARIHAQLLRNQGLDKEAYVFLRDLHAKLPNTPYAQKGIVLERIRNLESDLKIPFWERYQPSESSPEEVPATQIDASKLNVGHENCEDGHHHHE